MNKWQTASESKSLNTHILKVINWLFYQSNKLASNLKTKITMEKRINFPKCIHNPENNTTILLKLFPPDLLERMHNTSNSSHLKVSNNC